MKRVLCIITVLLVSITFFSIKLLIVRGDANYPPLEFVENDQLKGIHIEIVEAVTKQLGWTYEIKNYPWARAVDMIKYGSADAILFYGRNSEREEFSYYLDLILTEQVKGFFIRAADASKIGYNGDLKYLAEHNFSIGTVLGYNYPEEFMKANLNVDSSKNDENLIDKLINKRNDMFIADILTTQYLLKTKNLTNIIIPIKPAFKPNYAYIGFSKKNGKSQSIIKNAEQNAKKFSDALRKFRTSKEYQNILNKYK